MDSFELWNNTNFHIFTPGNPHLPYAEGPHIIVAPVQYEATAAWDNPKLAGAAFELGAKACGIMVRLGLAPWFNLQANGNWGLLPGAVHRFHIHLYGRNKTASWGKPVVLPELPDTFKNDPMPEEDRIRLMAAFTIEL